MQPLNQYSGSPVAGVNAAKGYGCWMGDQHNISNIFVIPNVQGDLAAWLDSNANSSLVDLGNTQTFQDFFTNGSLTLGQANQGGSSFRNLTVIGDRLSTQPQNGLVFYGPTQFAYIDNIIVDFMKGRGFYAGAADNLTAPSGDFNESVVQNVRLENDGDGPAVPAFEITATGPAQGSNTVSLVNIRIYQPIGTGLWIHNSGTSKTAPGFRLANLYIEGSKVDATTLGGDLFEIGDPAPSTSAVSSLLARNVQLVNPAGGYAALHIVGASSTDATNIDIDGSIAGSGNDFGRGLQVEACSGCSFKFAGNSATDYQLAIGANGTAIPTNPLAQIECVNSAVAAPGIIYDGEGAEPGLTNCVDLSAASLVQTPVRELLSSVAPGAAIAHRGPQRPSGGARRSRHASTPIAAPTDHSSHVLR